METAEEPMTPFGTFTAQSNKLQRVCSSKRLSAVTISIANTYDPSSNTKHSSTSRHPM